MKGYASAYPFQLIHLLKGKPVNRLLTALLLLVAINLFVAEPVEAYFQLITLNLSGCEVLDNFVPLNKINPL